MGGHIGGLAECTLEEFGQRIRRASVGSYEWGVVRTERRGLTVTSRLVGGNPIWNGASRFKPPLKGDH